MGRHQQAGRSGCRHCWPVQTRPSRRSASRRCPSVLDPADDAERIRRGSARRAARDPRDRRGESTARVRSRVWPSSGTGECCSAPMRTPSRRTRTAAQPIASDDSRLSRQTHPRPSRSTIPRCNSSSNALAAQCFPPAASSGPSRGLGSSPTMAKSRWSSAVARRVTEIAHAHSPYARYRLFGEVGSRLCVVVVRAVAAPSRRRRRSVGSNNERDRCSLDVAAVISSQLAVALCPSSSRAGWQDCVTDRRHDMRQASTGRSERRGRRHAVKTMERMKPLAVSRNALVQCGWRPSVAVRRPASTERVRPASSAPRAPWSQARLAPRSSLQCRIVGSRSGWAQDHPLGGDDRAAGTERRSAGIPSRASSGRARPSMPRPASRGARRSGPGRRAARSARSPRTVGALPVKMRWASSRRRATLTASMRATSSSTAMGRPEQQHLAAPAGRRAAAGSRGSSAGSPASGARARDSSCSLISCAACSSSPSSTGISLSMSSPPVAAWMPNRPVSAKLQWKE